MGENFVRLKVARNSSMMSDNLNKNIIVLVALYIIPLNGLSVDIYVPSLPAVANYFSTSDLLVQNTISIYILGLGISQLICGNIIDHFGRRQPLLISLCGYFVVSILIVTSKSIGMVTCSTCGPRNLYGI